MQEKLKKTLAAQLVKHLHSLCTTIFQTKNKKVCHGIQYILLIGFSLVICICSRMKLSQVQQNLLLERSWNGDKLVLQGPSFKKKLQSFEDRKIK